MMLSCTWATITDRQYLLWTAYHEDVSLEYIATSFLHAHEIEERKSSYYVFDKNLVAMVSEIFDILYVNTELQNTFISI